MISSESKSEYIVVYVCMYVCMYAVCGNLVHKPTAYNHIVM